MKNKRVFARLMARELTAEELASAAGGMMASGGGGHTKGGTCSSTACMGAGGRYIVDDSIPD